MLDADDEGKRTFELDSKTLLYKAWRLGTRHKAWWKPKTRCRGLVGLAQHSDNEKRLRIFRLFSKLASKHTSSDTSPTRVEDLTIYRPKGEAV
jgi:hypothetical protein